MMTAEETRKTMAEFIASVGLSMTVEHAGRNPNMDSTSPMDHWECTLEVDGRFMVVPFSMGKGLGGEEPTAETVLDCLASDSSGIESSFEDWCSELGYDPDSRKAERIYNVCRKQAEEL